MKVRTQYTLSSAVIVTNEPVFIHWCRPSRSTTLSSNVDQDTTFYPHFHRLVTNIVQLAMIYLALIIIPQGKGQLVQLVSLN